MKGQFPNLSKSLPGVKSVLKEPQSSASDRARTFHPFFSPLCPLKNTNHRVPIRHPRGATLTLGGSVTSRNKHHSIRRKTGEGRSGGESEGEGVGALRVRLHLGEQEWWVSGVVRVRIMQD